ncbi:MAG TPA: response regulator, partial [Phenylobacterium sp.]|nr:response regulator [Phenylobacterium sp.]
GSAHQDAAAALPRAPAERRPGGLDVLVAEDNDLNLDVMRGFLLHLGHRVHAARNGQEAVDVLQALRPDSVLMDMQMPVMDGLAATRAIRSREAELGAPRLPVLMLSANAMRRHQEEAQAAGADRHVAKPVTAQALLEAMARALPDPVAL